MRRVRRALILCALAALASCAGPPARDYRLLAQGPGVRVYDLRLRALAVARIVMPPGMNRRRVLRSAGATRIRAVPHARWMAPLGTLMRLTLAQDLARIIRPSRRVRLPGQRLPKHGSALVFVTVQAFLPTPRGVRLDARWSVACRASHASLSHGRVHIRVATAPEALALSESMSDAVKRLAGTIADRLRPAPAGVSGVTRPPPVLRCP